MTKRFTEDQVVRILREAESKQESICDVCKRHNSTEQNFFRWRNKFGGMDLAEAKRLRNWSLRTPSSNACWPSSCWSSRAGRSSREKMSSPSGRRAAVRAMTCRGISERRACQSFNGKLRDELLNREWFRTLPEAKVLIEAWRQFYNERRPHSALAYRPPAAVRREWSATDNITPILTA